MCPRVGIATNQPPRPKVELLPKFCRILCIALGDALLVLELFDRGGIGVDYASLSSVVYQPSRRDFGWSTTRRIYPSFFFVWGGGGGGPIPDSFVEDPSRGSYELHVIRRFCRVHPVGRQFPYDVVSLIIWEACRWSLDQSSTYYLKWSAVVKWDVQISEIHAPPYVTSLTVLFFHPQWWWLLLYQRVPCPGCHRVLACQSMACLGLSIRTTANTPAAPLQICANPGPPSAHQDPLACRPSSS